MKARRDRQAKEAAKAARGGGQDGGDPAAEGGEDAPEMQEKSHATLMAHANTEKKHRGAIHDGHIDIHAMEQDPLHPDWETIVDEPLHVAWMHWPTTATHITVRDGAVVESSRPSVTAI